MSLIHQPTVIATFSRRMRLQLTDGRQVDARIKGKRVKPVCGDRVTVETIADEEDWLITGILPRSNALSRPNSRGQTEILAANVDMLVAVAAATPRTDWFIVDRYLCAAEIMGIAAMVVFNKIDIAGPDSDEARILEEYAGLGYPVTRCSATSGQNLDEIATRLSACTAVIVGQSGVGKSSLINGLTPGEDLTTAALSTKRGEGRHTTVNSMMLFLPAGGAVIDSPGVRDYAPALHGAAEVGRGFREVEQLRMHCRFANCRHTREPGCAVKRAVADARMSERRYESYKRLLNITEQFTRKFSP